LHAALDLISFPPAGGFARRQAHLQPAEEQGISPKEFLRDCFFLSSQKDRFSFFTAVKPYPIFRSIPWSSAPVQTRAFFLLVHRTPSEIQKNPSEPDRPKDQVCQKESGNSKAHFTIILKLARRRRTQTVRILTFRLHEFLRFFLKADRVLYIFPISANPESGEITCPAQTDVSGFSLRLFS